MWRLKQQKWREKSFARQCYQRVAELESKVLELVMMKATLIDLL